MVLGRLVLGRQLHAGGIGIGHAGVGQQLHSFGLCGLDDRAVLLYPLAHLAAGDQQYALGSPERCGHGVGVRIVNGADLDALAGEVRQLVDGPSGCHDVAGGNATLQQGLDDVAAKVSGGSCDDDAHG